MPTQGEPMRHAIFAILLAAIAALAHAQAPKGEGRFDCSRAKDPKACEARRDKLVAAHERAEKACAGREGAAHSECITHEMCSQAKDPKACEERVSHMRDKAKSVRAACEGRQGAARTDCVVKERCAEAKDAARCEAEVRSGMARREKIR